MYQALYRKWRPRTFDDVVGQAHITDTLSRQVSAGRPSHAYLFTGARGTGKTSCAKILARAVNCQAPREGNPCNACPTCLGIENGSILDVLELDAASNNGVDHVRALRDEAVYTPAAAQKRVYIVDEVHMLSTPAFNALLKILEEPPVHLMFILATTELHKVPATIRSRCQQFAFKRITVPQIARRLEQVAEAEGLTLTAEAANLLARLADGGLRDALSLLDQCSGAGGEMDEARVLDTLGLAGNVETAALLERVGQRDTGGALTALHRLYENGKDMASLMGELSGLARDLLLRKTAPIGGAALAAGGYDEATLRALGELFSAQRLLDVLTRLQETAATLPRSRNRRTEGELCLIRLCDETLEDTPTALSARLARLEARLEPGTGFLPPSPPVLPAREKKNQLDSPVTDDPPPWQAEPEEAARVPAPPPSRRAPVPPKGAEKRTTPAAPTLAGGAGESAFWPALAAAAKGRVPPSVGPYLANPAKVAGRWSDGVLTLWTDSDFTKAMLEKPTVTESLAKLAEEKLGRAVRVTIRVGPAPGEAASAPESAAENPSANAEPIPPAEGDALEDLLAFGAQFDNITIQ